MPLRNAAAFAMPKDIQSGVASAEAELSESLPAREEPLHCTAAADHKAQQEEGQQKYLLHERCSRKRGPWVLGKSQ